MISFDQESDVPHGMRDNLFFKFARALFWAWGGNTNCSQFLQWQVTDIFLVKLKLIRVSDIGQNNLIGRRITPAGGMNDKFLFDLTCGCVVFLLN